MIRNLKVLILAAMALAAFGALAASGAQAKEFRCSVEPCRVTLKPDGAVGSKTAHQVFVVENKGTEIKESVAFTCEQTTGEGTSSKKTAKELLIKNISYDGCNVIGGGAVTVKMNGCNYFFKAEPGTVTIQECEAGKQIEIKLGTGCVFTIGSQGPLAGIAYHTSGVAPNRELTLETDVHGIRTTIADNGNDTKALCGIEPAAELEGTYTTGNTILTGETDPGGVMAETWFE
jgi:hypothetical protein